MLPLRFQPLGHRCFFRSRDLFCLGSCCFSSLADRSLFSLPGFFLLLGLLRFRGLRLILGPLHIGAFLAHFNIHGLAATGAAAGLQLRCGTAFERDLARPAAFTTLAAPEERQKRLFFLVGNHIIFRPLTQPGFLKLTEQAINGSAHIFGQLLYSDFRHTGPPLPIIPGLQTMAHGLS